METNIQTKDNYTDTITYTGGKDKYVSLDKNTKYTIRNFGKDTKPVNYDNPEALTKKEYKMENDEFDIVEHDNIVSTNDKLYIDTTKDKNSILF